MLVWFTARHSPSFAIHHHSSLIIHVDHLHPRTIRAPRGTELSCKGWQQEAALRMLMNNLDPEVAERPDDLVVYGGTGKAARNWECFDAIVALAALARGRRDAAGAVGQAGGRLPHARATRRAC